MSGRVMEACKSLAIDESAFNKTNAAVKRLLLEANAIRAAFAANMSELEEEGLTPQERAVLLYAYKESARDIGAVVERALSNGIYIIG